MRSLLPVSILFFLSGLTALVYQVAWTRSFGLVFGSTTRAASVVLAAFFAGMALGNLVGGRLARSRARSLLGYGWAELVVAAGALAVLAWLSLYRELYPFLYRSLPGVPTLTALQLALAFVAMAPPCIAMGATLPFMSRAVVTRAEHLGRRVAAFYALNTVGATAGVLLSGFLLPIWIGTRGAVLLAVILNVALGLGALALGRAWTARERDDVPAPASDASPAKPLPSTPLDPLVVFAAASSGFGTLALEVLYTRLIVHVIDTSVYSFALMLATFLVSLALGSAFVALVVDRLQRPWQLVAWASALGAVAVMISPSVFGWAHEALPRPSAQGPGAYLTWLLLFGLLVMGPAAFLVGIVLPTVWRIATRRAEEAGGRIGTLTGINTAAAVTGSLAAGFVFVPRLGLGGGVLLVAILYGSLAVLALLRVADASVRWAAALAFAGGLVGLALLGPWRVLPLDLDDADRLIFYHEGETGSVAVTERPRGRLLRLNNRYTLGGSRPLGILTHRSQGRLPLLLHGEPRHVAFIGVATGISLSSIKQSASVESAVAMEIVPGVLAANWAFAEANLNVLEDPRVEVLVADGRNHLFGTERRFDVIVADLFVPWQAGTGYLYTAEHFRIVRERLEPGGVFAQWLQVDQLSQEELRIVTGTFTDVFPESELWLNTIQRGRPLLALVGRNGAPDPARTRALRERAAEELGDLRFLCPGAALRSWAEGAKRNTDDYPVIEFSSASSHLRRRRGHVAATLRTLVTRCRADAAPDRP